MATTKAGGNGTGAVGAGTGEEAGAAAPPKRAARSRAAAPQAAEAAPAPRGARGGTARKASAAAATVDTAPPATVRTAGGTRAAGTARKTGTAAGTGRSAVARGGVTGDGEGDLREHLRRFAAARPNGWNHDDWLGLLDELRGHGHDISNPDAVGATLERERLLLVLEGVDGLGPRRAQTLATRFETLYSLRHAGASEIASAARLPLPLATRVAESVR